VLDVNAEGTNIVKALSSEFSDASFSFHKVDISNWDELAAAFEQIHQDQGRIDVVMANAGISKEGPLIVDEETPSKPNLPTLEVNLIGTIYSEWLVFLSWLIFGTDPLAAVKLAIHYIKKNAPVNGAMPASRGSIICTASNAGLYPFPVAPIYAASKFGVVGLVRSLARPLEKQAIQINALAPAVLGMCFIHESGRSGFNLFDRNEYRAEQRPFQADDHDPYVDLDERSATAGVRFIVDWPDRRDPRQQCNLGPAAALCG